MKRVSFLEHFFEVSEILCLQELVLSSSLLLFTALAYCKGITAPDNPIIVAADIANNITGRKKL
jgi:hypothetical protein